MNIVDRLNHKRIIIWGYGREGKSTEQFILQNVTPASLFVFEGSYEEIKDQKCDVIIKSPGIRCVEEDDRLTSQTELFVSQFRDQIVGITGTKGKSTTATMLYSVLCGCGKDAVLVGNIGLPCLDFYHVIKDDTIIVFEMSCHQLQKQKESPHIGVFLNLYEDHLDYYGDMEHYFAAKKNIISHQKEEDYALLGSEVPEINSMGNQIGFSLEDCSLSIPMELTGAHNQFNATIVIYIAVQLLGCKRDSVENTILSFKGLRHRMERLGEHQGVIYYDDSISTIPEATIRAVESISNVRTVLIGGMDRGISYEKLLDLIKNRKDLFFVLMYGTGKRIFEEALKPAHCILVSDLKQAVEQAKIITKPGEACILSPAAASYDCFKSFEERGDLFREFVFS